jgi:hypothetical protein
VEEVRYSFRRANKVNHKYLFAGVAAAALMAAGNAYAGAHASTEDQLKAQAAMIDALSKEVEALKAGVDAGGRIEKGVGGVNLKISGQVNRGVLYASDANDDSFFNFVDNDASSTRVRWDADAKTSNGMTVGTRLEVQMESNTSFNVGGNGTVNNEVGVNTNAVDANGNAAVATTGDVFNLRHAYVFIQGGFGTLTTGQQGEATEGILHNSFNYASLADINPEYTAGIGAAGANFLSFGDGGRQDSLRYDTPSFGGAKAAISVRDNGEVTAAVRYAGKVAGFGVLGGVGYEENFGNQNISGSFGLNFGPVALNGALATRLNEGNADNDFFYYLGLAHKGSYIDMGSTSLAIDYTNRNGAGQANNDQNIGFGIVQGMAPGAEAYVSFRHHFGGDVQDSAQVGLAGMRVKF